MTVLCLFLFYRFRPCYKGHFLVVQWSVRTTQSDEEHFLMDDIMLWSSFCFLGSCYYEDGLKAPFEDGLKIFFAKKLCFCLFCAFQVFTIKRMVWRTRLKMVWRRLFFKILCFGLCFPGFYHKRGWFGNPVWRWFDIPIWR